MEMQGRATRRPRENEPRVWRRSRPRPRSMSNPRCKPSPAAFEADAIVPDPEGHEEPKRRPTPLPPLDSPPGSPKGCSATWFCIRSLMDLLRGKVSKSSQGSGEETSSGEQISLDSGRKTSQDSGKQTSPDSGSYLEEAADPGGSTEAAIAPGEGTTVVSTAPTAPGRRASDSDSTQLHRRRLVVVGSPEVGKSSILARFLERDVPFLHVPTIEDFYTKLYRVGTQMYQLDLMDCAGFNPYPSHKRMTYLNGDIFILVFDMSRRVTFEETIKIRQQILHEHARAADNLGSKRPAKLPPVPMVLVGNKTDLSPREVDLSEAKALVANQESFAFVPVSARLDSQMDVLFINLMEVAKLPIELAPKRHTSFVSTDGTMPVEFNLRRGPLRRYSYEACGVLALNTSPPSLSSEISTMRDRVHRPLPTAKTKTGCCKQQ